MKKVIIEYEMTYLGEIELEVGNDFDVDSDDDIHNALSELGENVLLENAEYDGFDGYDAFEEE